MFRSSVMASQSFQWLRAEVQRSYNTTTPVTGILELTLNMEPGGEVAQRSRARRFILNDIVPQSLSQGTIQPDQQIVIDFLPARQQVDQCIFYFTRDTRPDPVKMRYVALIIEQLNQALGNVAGHQTLGVVGRASLEYLFCKPLDMFPIEQWVEIHIPAQPRDTNGDDE